MRGLNVFLAGGVSLAAALLLALPGCPTQRTLTETARELHDNYAAANTDGMPGLTLGEARARLARLRAADFEAMDSNNDETLSLEELALAAGLEPGEGEGEGELPVVSLASFAISGAENPVYPAFDAERTHYALHPGLTDSLELTATAGDPADWVSVHGGAWQQGEAVTELSALTPGEDIMISVASSQGVTNHYVVHYLHERFPRIEIVKTSENVTDELLFMAPGVRIGDVPVCFIAMIDNAGVPHFHRLMDSRIASYKLQRDGRISVAVQGERNEFGRADYEILLLGPDLEVAGRAGTVGLNHTDGHDFIITETGNYILVSYHTRIADMTEFGFSDQEFVGDSVIQEITPEGEVVWQWSTEGAIEMQECTQYWLFPGDWAHINSIFLTDDNAIVASFRGCSQVLKIDRDTGAVLWRFGGPHSTFALVDDPFGEFCGQHTASILPNGDLLFFDNGGFCPGPREELYGQFSRVVAYELDQAFGEARLVWEYPLVSDVAQYSSSQGSAQYLDSGHIVVGWGAGTDIAVTELDAAGNEVFAMRMLDESRRSVSYQALRFPGYAVPLVPVHPPLPTRK